MEQKERKYSSTTFLKVLVFFIGIAVLAICVFVVPWMVRNDVGKHPDTAYWSYSFLVYVYLLCIPVYVALYQAFKFFIYIDKNMAFSELSVKALKYIKYCAITVSSFIVVGLLTIVAMFYDTGEDITGIIMLSFIGIFASFVIATFVGVLQSLLQEVIDIKSENDLTI